MAIMRRAAGAARVWRLEDSNLLVSVLARTPGRARREIKTRLRALGDPAPIVMPTGRRALVAVSTSLDPRTVVRGLHTVAATTPEVFRATSKWVPVDRWTATSMEAMCKGVEILRDRIAATERWRMTVRAQRTGDLSAAAIIDRLADLVSARVDLAHPDKILMVQVFPGAVALSVLAPADVFSVVAATRPPMPSTLDALSASLPALPLALAERLAGIVQDTARPFRDSVDLALELLGGVVPAWPVLSEWNRWCVRHGVSFFVWSRSRGELSDRQRAVALLHTVMMLAAKKHAIHDYLAAGVREAEVAMAGDDCVICDDHRHARIPLDGRADGELPPYHPGCRCGFRPHLG
jgi:tRNA acetyltransferase TAN1